MKRSELIKARLVEENSFIKSIKGKCLTSLEKSKFRRTRFWKEFRSGFKDKVDPITLKKVPKNFQLHHMRLDPCKYTDLDEKYFVPLNGTTHDILHYLYEYYRKDKTILKRIEFLLDEMVEWNDSKNIRDFKSNIK